MDLAAPYRVVLSPSDGRALAVLARERGPLTGRDVARLGGGPKTTVARALSRLAEHGLVNARDIGGGRYTLYSLNREHLAAEPVIRLLELPRALLDRLYLEFEGWSTPPLSASLLGTVTSGLGVISSDIEIVLARAHHVDAFDANWLQQLNGLSERVRRWTGNRASLVQVAEEDLDRLRQERPPLVEDLETGATNLYGPPFPRLLRASGRAQSDDRATS